MYYNVFFELAKEYKDRIQFIFKPHPLLLNKLYSQDVWGKEKTDIYYEKWNGLENGMLVLGRYEEIFITSDAMIHDSGSFLIEYLCVNKPVLHTSRDENITDRMNSFGKMAYEHHYHARNVEEIRTFLEMILKGNDSLKPSREVFIKECLIPPNGKSASENILEEIVSELY
jgi:CDP-glycerol glycerophosphotransferase (TagB/SpsB family)